MAVKTKTQLATTINSVITGGGNITASDLNGILIDMVDSYEDLIQEKTTVQRDALAGGDLYTGRKIFNTTNSRMEFYNGTSWIACSQKPTVAVDCSANPNYQEGSVGDGYIVSVAGKIGGASGTSVYVGDIIYCVTKSAAGDQATVGANWKVCHSQSATDSPTFLAELTLSSADILSSNGTPLVLVAAPGAGKIIVPVSPIVATMTFNSIAYATNTSLRALWDDENSVTIFDLSATANACKITQFELAQHDTYENTALRVATNNGNPTAGNSTMKVRVYYKILTL